jgi:hypothetical protein
MERKITWMKNGRSARALGSLSIPNPFLPQTRVLRRMVSLCKPFSRVTEPRSIHTSLVQQRKTQFRFALRGNRRLQNTWRFFSSGRAFHLHSQLRHHPHTLSRTATQSFRSPALTSARWRKNRSPQLYLTCRSVGARCHPRDQTSHSRGSFAISEFSSGHRIRGTAN